MSIVSPGYLGIQSNLRALAATRADFRGSYLLSHKRLKGDNFGEIWYKASLRGSLSEVLKEL